MIPELQYHRIVVAGDKTGRLFEAARKLSGRIKVEAHEVPDTAEDYDSSLFVAPLRDRSDAWERFYDDRGFNPLLQDPGADLDHNAKIIARAAMLDYPMGCSDPH